MKYRGIQAYAVNPNFKYDLSILNEYLPLFQKNNTMKANMDFLAKHIGMTYTPRATEYVVHVYCII